MRGKVTAGSPLVNDIGITPAYAGKSVGTCYPHGTVWDHPRLCGEKFSIFLTCGVVTGSPPPMRGKGSGGGGGHRGDRITPAYAGKSPTKTPNTPCKKDHPRLCGEKAMLVCLRRISTGSPPPMRGKVGRLENTDRRKRITPAYAGKRKRLFRSILIEKDHPRLCGEKIISLL